MNDRHRTLDKFMKASKKVAAAALAGAAIMSSVVLAPVVSAATPPEVTAPPEQTQQAAASRETAKPPVNFEKVLHIKATAYAPGAHDNEQWGNKTHLGTQVRPGIIAVDPKVIPLGSKVYIEYPDGKGVYAVAEDTGGAIKGHRIDVAKWTVKEAEKFGIQNVKVYVVSTPASKAKV
ncbi:MAG: hypothetical protein H6Q74_265 [Firmicutes bacterium]|nr:hypothetical protein [Bacillota bacterium]